jgi:hypothetical protein
LTTKSTVLFVETVNFAEINKIYKISLVALLATTNEGSGNVMMSALTIAAPSERIALVCLTYWKNNKVKLKGETEPK